MFLINNVGGKGQVYREKCFLSNIGGKVPYLWGWEVLINDVWAWSQTHGDLCFGTFTIRGRGYLPMM